MDHIFVSAGQISGDGTSSDFATVKYAPDGTELWVVGYDGPANSYDITRDIAVDNSGNIYVSGGSEGIGTSTDYATIKYASDGTELWVARYNGPANSYDTAYAIAVDNSGNIYVTGQSAGSSTAADYATVKYAPDGTELWVARYNGPADYSDVAVDIALDDSDNIYVTGLSYGSGNSYDYATVKYPEYSPSPSMAIANLIAHVKSLNLQQGIDNSLDAKLSAAQKALEDLNENNNVAAVNALEAFINAVEAQKGNKISIEDADTLIAMAQDIIAIINGT
jgi:hypothetical protein